MEYKIRKALMEDAKKINLLFTELMLDERQYDQNIEENVMINHYFEDIIPYTNNYVLVILVNDVIVGFLYGYIYENNLARLKSLFIKKEYRNKGLASALIKEFLSLVKSRGVTDVEVNVFKDNVKALTLYEKFNLNVIKHDMSKKI